MILWLPTDAPKDVSARISTQIVYVLDRTDLKLKAIDYDLIEFFGFGWFSRTLRGRLNI